jgi:hypothetical protein
MKAGTVTFFSLVDKAGILVTLQLSFRLLKEPSTQKITGILTPTYK